ncbi:MAG: phosphohydrolase [Rhodoferax sp.]|nr:phosphohydrolase [Rhodoferax sp.]
MSLVTISIESVRIGHPLPFSLRDVGGVMLAAKGYIIRSRADLDQIVAQRGELYVDVAESEAHHRAYVGKLYDLVRKEKSLGKIADAQISSDDLEVAHETADTGEADWLDLQSQSHTMLRDSNPVTFGSRLNKLQAQLSRHSRANPDGTLFALIHLSATETRLYSATHAMLVSVMCTLAAREVLKWPDAQEATLGKAALTMNIGMTELQDRLAQQKEPPNAAQRSQIEEHCTESVRLLEQLGIADPCWLEAVGQHHSHTPGPLGARTEGQRMARLIQRADMFAAHLAPRASRMPMAPATAMQACYFDENKKPDEAGAALVKATGIYSPGSFVRLTNNEVAVVIKRGANTTTPRVAVLVNRSGMPVAEMVVRDTSNHDFRIIASVPHRDVKVKINLERLMAFAKSVSVERPW